MSAGISLGGCLSYEGIRTKADVMKFALVVTSRAGKGNTLVFNKKRAKQLFDFFCENVELKDSEVLSVDEFMGPILDGIRSVTERKTAES